MTAAHLIEQSIAEDRIVRASENELTLEDIIYLVCNSYDYVESDGETEYWVEDDNGNQWRIHIV